MPTLRVNRFVFQHGTPHVWRVDQGSPVRLELMNTYLTQSSFCEPDKEMLADLHDSPRYDLMWLEVGSVWISRPHSSYATPPYDIEAVYEITERTSRVVFREYPLDGSESKMLSLSVFQFMCQAIRLYPSLEEMTNIPLLSSLLRTQEQTPEERDDYLYWVNGTTSEVPIQTVFRERKEALAHANLQAEILGIPRRSLRVSKRLAEVVSPGLANLKARKKKPAPVPVHPSRFSYLDGDDDVE